MGSIDRVEIGAVNHHQHFNCSRSIQIMIFRRHGLLIIIFKKLRPYTLIYTYTASKYTSIYWIMARNGSHDRRYSSLMRKKNNSIPFYDGGSMLLVCFMTSCAHRKDFIFIFCIANCLFCLLYTI